MYEEMKATGCDEIIAISISEKLSGTYQNAVLAAKMIEGVKVHVFDSMTVSYPEAKMANLAQKLADQNVPAAKILEELGKIPATITTSSSASTPSSTSSRTAACPTPPASSARSLKLKPLLEVTKDGKVSTVEKIRTTQKAREAMLGRFLTEIAGKSVEAFIIYTNNFDVVADLKDELEEKHGLKDVKLVPLTPVVGCHAGPGTMGPRLHRQPISESKENETP
ncbi:MAG: DegV family EDD domain-containing protein [Bacillus subtilis]|nr:DegV family EDD domain-containing protein [Bacillus subtilis]